MKRMLFILLILLGIPLTTNAQDTVDPMDISEYFTNYVTVVDIKDIVPPVDTRPTYDDTLREIRVYDEAMETWRTYPYPEGVERVVDADWYSEDTFIVSTLQIYGYSTVDPTGDWILDLETGEYTRPELMCGLWRAEAGQGRWVGYLNPEDEIILCNTETGEQISPDVDYIRGVSLSPNQDTVALFAQDGIYTYTFSSQQLIRVGETRSYDFESIRWLGNEWLLIRQTQMADMSFPWIYYSLANAYEADSMQWINTVNKPGDWIPLENPTRYEWIDSSGEDCLLIQIHVADGHRDAYNIGDICSQGWFISDSDERLTTTLITEETEWENTYHIVGRRLMRFNPYTGEQHLILEGEIEDIYDITFDGHYAVLVMDDSGQVDMLTETQLQTFFYDHEHTNVNFRYVIFDLFHEAIIYETPTDARIDSVIVQDWFDNESGVFRIGGLLTGNYYTLTPTDSVMYIGDDRFIFGRFNQEQHQQNYLLLNIGIETIEQPIDTPLLLLDDNHLLTSRKSESNNTEFFVFDTTSGESNLILNVPLQYRDDNAYIGEDYRYWLSWLHGNTEDTIIFRVWDTETDMQRDYILQLPSTN